MTLIECLYYDFDHLSWDVLLEYVAELVVAWLSASIFYFFSVRHNLLMG